VEVGVKHFFLQKISGLAKNVHQRPFTDTLDSPVPAGASTAV